MTALLALARAIDRLNGLIGRFATWLIPLVVLIAASVVVLRYVGRVGYPWLSESFIWLHGATFMIAAAYVLSIEGHVRVDVFYRRFGPRWRAAVNVFGVLCLLWPTTYVLGTRSLPIAERAWRMKEASPTPDGLPFMYLFKALIIVFCVLLALQGLSLLIRSLAVLSGAPQWQHLMSRPSDGAQSEGAASKGAESATEARNA